MNRLSKTLVAAFALTAMLGGAIAHAGATMRLESRLDGSRAAARQMKGKVKFEHRADRDRRKFSLEIERGRPGQMFDVMVSGKVVGTVQIDNLGRGELDFDDTAGPLDRDQRFPRGFPAIDGGEVVQVGPLTGSLQFK